MTPEEERQQDERIERWLERQYRREQKPGVGGRKILAWVLYGLLSWTVISMAVFPPDRYRLGAAALLTLAAIWLLDLTGEEDDDDVG